MKASVAGKENNEVIKFRVHGAWVLQGPHRCPTAGCVVCVCLWERSDRERWDEGHWMDNTGFSLCVPI